MRGHDYTAPGAYYVTLCACRGMTPFGDRLHDRVLLNELGRVVEETWKWIPIQYPYVALDEYCVMPDHFHGILTVLAPPSDLAIGVDALSIAVAAPRKSVGGLIGAFKTVSAKQVNRVRGTPGQKVWQRDFYDHIVGDAHDLDRIRGYIRSNPTAVGTPNHPSGGLRPE